MSALSDPEGRRLLRVEVRNTRTLTEKEPERIWTTAIAGQNYQDMRDLSYHKGLHMVCVGVGCPNICEHQQDREATFLLGGAVCMRCCDFCDIVTGYPNKYDQSEPRRITESVTQLELRYATITGATRDDLPDDAAWLYVETCHRVYELSPSMGVELPVDDFRGHDGSIDVVVEVVPQVFAHSPEAAPRIFKKIRPAFRYERSLAVTR